MSGDTVSRWRGGRRDIGGCGDVGDKEKSDEGRVKAA